MRKFLGIVLIIFGCILALAITFGSIPTIIDAINMELDLIGKSSYLFGTFLGFVLMELIPFWLIKVGIKLTKPKLGRHFKEKIESIK